MKIISLLQVNFSHQFLDRLKCPLRYFATDFKPNLKERCSKNVNKTFTIVQLKLEIACHQADRINGLKIACLYSLTTNDLLF